MEVIALILFIVLMFANLGGKSRKQAAEAKKRAQAANRAGARQAAGDGSAVEQEFEDALSGLREKLERVERAGQAWVGAPAQPKPEPVVRARDLGRVRQGAAMLDDPQCHGGSMAHTHAEGNSALEDEDCVGGSMAHDHTEGVNRAAHARRMAAIDAVGDADVLPEVIDARALRRAVVMAEVLGKPKAMKRAGL